MFRHLGATAVLGPLAALALAAGCGPATTSSAGDQPSSPSLVTTTATTAGAGASSQAAVAGQDRLPLSQTSTSGPTSTATVASPTSATETTSVAFEDALSGSAADATQLVALAIVSRVADVATDELRRQVLEILNDDRGWVRAGFTFVAVDDSPFQVILAEGAEVDQMCLPLVTYGTVSCQNGPVVALNATRWRSAVDHWDADLIDYRSYLVNHEVGHLVGQRHPQPRCPIEGRPAGVMEQQTAGLEGCTGNAWPRDWEIDLAARRPIVYAPLPDWGPDPIPANDER